MFAGEEIAPDGQRRERRTWDALRLALIPAAWKIPARFRLDVALTSGENRTAAIDLLFLRRAGRKWIDRRLSKRNSFQIRSNSTNHKIRERFYISSSIAFPSK